MNIIKTFENFSINEKVGLAKPTLIVSDFLLEEFKVFFNRFIESNTSELKEIKKYNDVDLIEIVESEYWKDMPVSSINIEFEIKRISDDQFSKKYPLTSKKRDFNSTGVCYGIDDKKNDGSYIELPIDKETDMTLHIKMEIGAILNTSFNDIDFLMLEIESTITHELNHAYEGWKRNISGKSQLSTELTWALDQNRSRIHSSIWGIWSGKISFYLYCSERHEINAMAQEAWPYVNKYDFHEMTSKLASWKHAENMFNFNADDFKKEISESINKLYPDVDPNLIISRLKNGLANQLIEYRKLSSKKDELPSISGEKIINMTNDQFFRFAEKRINIAGDKLKRRISRLYSIKEEK